MTELDKAVTTAAEAIADVGDGAPIAVGGFGLCGTPQTLIGALYETGATDISVVSNNCGIDDVGLGVLLSAARISRITASYVGENKEFARQFLSGAIEVELMPQGRLAERLRAGGAGIPAFYTPAGVGTLVAEGGLPWRYGPDGEVVKSSPTKEVREFDGAPYVLETAITTDFALVHAWKGDRHGNLMYRKSARNFNPVCAGAGRVTIAEVEELVKAGELDPKEVHTPGIQVQRVILVPSLCKHIEKRKTRDGQENHQWPGTATNLPPEWLRSCTAART
jgi:3-oxoacid CoA-transferase subunit A